MKRKGQQIIKVKDYGDDWVNRLAAACDALDRMEPQERAAALNFIQSKYGGKSPLGNR